MSYAIVPATPAGERVIGAAGGLIEAFRSRADSADRASEICPENYADLQRTGVAAAFVPEELGGLGLHSMHDWILTIATLAKGDGSAAIAISIDADYSDHAKATGGLYVYILKDINGTDYEAEGDGPWGFEMPFTQNGTNRRTITLSAKDFPKFKIYLDWDNSTGSSSVDVVTKYKRATIPAAA